MDILREIFYASLKQWDLLLTAFLCLGIPVISVLVILFRRIRSKKLEKVTLMESFSNKDNQILLFFGVTGLCILIIVMVTILTSIPIGDPLYSITPVPTY